MAQGQTMILSAETLGLLNDFVANFSKKDKVKEVANIAQAIAFDISKDKQYAKGLKEEVLEQVKGEIATKDFVRAEISSVELSLRAEIYAAKLDLIKWIISAAAVSIVTIVGATWTLFTYLK